MKRLLSLLLVVAMLFGVCTVFTACDDSSSVSDEEKDSGKKKQNVLDTFKGLKVALPKSFEKESSDDYNALYSNDDYQVYVSYEENYDDVSAKDLQKEYKEELDEALEEGYMEKGKSGKTDNNTRYVYGIAADEPYATAVAFYTTDNSVWIVQIRNTDDNEDYDIDKMISYITDWDYSDPKDEEEEEENEGNENEGDVVVPQQPTASTGIGTEQEEVSGEIIYDNMGIVITWTGMEKDDYYTLLELHVENNSGYDIELSGYNFILNYEATFPAYLYCRVGDGESSYYEVALYAFDLAAFGADEVGSLEFTVRITDSHSYQTLDDGVRACIRTDYDGYYNNVVPSDIMVYEDGYIRVFLQEINLSELHESRMYLYIENISDEVIHVNIEEFYALGWRLDAAYVGDTVMPGTYTISTVDFSELYKLGLASPDHLENLYASVTCMNEDYRTVSHGELYYCPGDPDAIFGYDTSGVTLFSNENMDIVLLAVISDDYCVEFEVYFHSGWDNFVDIRFSDAVINEQEVGGGISFSIKPGMQYLATLRLWYDEAYGFTCLEDLQSLVMHLEVNCDYNLIVDEQVEIPLN